MEDGTRGLLVTITTHIIIGMGASRNPRHSALLLACCWERTTFDYNCLESMRRALALLALQPKNDKQRLAAHAKSCKFFQF
jgi:hypothetical protein